MKLFNYKKSKLKDKLKSNKITIGSWLTIPSFQIVEIMGTAGFEWLAIDLEHAPISIESTANLIGHIQANDMQALVRVSKNEEVIIKRVLDAGADGIIIPMIKNKKEAIEAINYSKYPPKGKRGVGLNRAQYYGTNFNEYKEWVENNLVVIAQIEHVDAVNNIEDIISVDGIDGVIIGPYDLSASIGFPGEYDKLEVKKEIDKLEKILLSNNFPSGFHVVESNSDFIIKKLNKGYKLLAFSLDFFFLGDKAREEMKKIKQHISD